MLMKVLLAVLLGLAVAYPEPEPVSKTTSLHSVHPPTITTPLGDVKGSTLSSRLGRTIYSFKGLRYAKPPINELRFQPPVPAEKWEGVINATNDGDSCSQRDCEQSSEDCLFLNVYTAKLVKGSDNPKRPVIIFFHDGNFYGSTGKSSSYGPQYLLDHDIVLVVPNYRIGALGFLSTTEKEVTGNYGLKDQVQAMKWVKDNIAAFGGNPDLVTIAGYGAGGVSVSIHLVSPLSAGLFHRAIIMSGALSGTWPLHSNQMELARKQAKLVNCPYDNAKNIIQCLKTKPASELANSASEFKELGDDPVFFWSPVLEPKVLPDSPIELIAKQQFQNVPVLAGITADEFGGRAFSLLGNDTALAELNKDFDKFAPILFHYERDTDVTKSVKKFCFGDKPIDKSQLPVLAQLYADALVGYNMHVMAKALAEKNVELYYYHFNFKGKFTNCYTPDSNNTVPFGASHLDDLIYLFHNTNFQQFKEGEVEITIIEKMTKMWANFATYGNPINEPSEKLDNVKWEKYTAKNRKYMDIGNKLGMGDNLHGKRYDDWESLFSVSKKSNVHSGHSG